MSNFLTHINSTSHFLLISLSIILGNFYGTLTNFSVPILFFHKIYKLTFIFMK